jgi:hypothetical protein
MAVKKPDEVQSVQPVAEQTGVGTAQNSNSSSGSYSYSYTGSTSAPTVEAPPPSQLPNQIPTNVEHQDVPDAPDLRPELDKWLAAAQEQANNQIDYATQQGITELERAQEDAQPQFQQMRDQVDANEARALDNQALYAEARGDRGGIGQAQYNSIQNTAAQNRLQVNQQQTKLATDTARQIADLRARGEFEKADKMLQLTQSYLSQLMQLEQWAAEYNMNAAQFRESIAQWNAEYQMKAAQILEDQRQWDASYALQLANFQQGQYEFNEQFQWQRDKAERDTLADAGQALLSAGIMPSASQLSAMGMTQEQARNYIAALQLYSQSSGGGSGGGGSSRSRSSSSSSSSGAGDYDLDALLAADGGTPGSYTGNERRHATGLQGSESYVYDPRTPRAEARPSASSSGRTILGVTMTGDKNKPSITFKGKTYSSEDAIAKLLSGLRGDELNRVMTALRHFGFAISEVKPATDNERRAGGHGQRPSQTLR